MKEVCTAVLEKDGKILIAQRPVEKHCGRLWEFPGGKLEAGESLQECVIRECREELGVAIAKPVLFETVTLEESGLRLHFFKASLHGALPVCKEHMALAWITPAQISQYGFCPSDQKMIEQAGIDALFAPVAKTDNGSQK